MGVEGGCQHCAHSVAAQPGCMPGTAALQSTRGNAQRGLPRLPPRRQHRGFTAGASLQTHLQRGRRHCRFCPGYEGWWGDEEGRRMPGLTACARCMHRRPLQQWCRCSRRLHLARYNSCPCHSPLHHVVRPDVVEPQIPVVGDQVGRGTVGRPAAAQSMPRHPTRWVLQAVPGRPSQAGPGRSTGPRAHSEWLA